MPCHDKSRDQALKVDFEELVGAGEKIAEAAEAMNVAKKAAQQEVVKEAKVAEKRPPAR